MKVKCSNLIESLKDARNKFDFSNLAKTCPLYSAENENALFRFKLETKMNYNIKAAVSLRNKCYSLLLEPTKWNKIPEEEQEQEVKVLKGIAKQTVRNSINFEMYYNALMKGEEKHCTFSKIEKKDFKISTQRQQKLALKAFEDKKWWLDCRVHSVPFGSIEIQENGSKCLKCSKK